DDASKKLRDQYVQHVTKMLTLLGEDPKAAGEHAKKILALETSLAQASRTKVELRDPQKNYNKMKTSALQALTPDFKWDAYFRSDDASKKLRDQYVQHVTKMLTLLGEDPKAAGEHAKKILALETSLAQASRTKVELRDPQKNYNKMKTSALQALTPDFKWDAYFKE